MKSAETCDVVLLTPPGRGAVATILVRGSGAVAVVGKHFQAADRRALGEQPANRVVFGRWGSEQGEEVVVCRLSESEVEIHGHGGAAAAGRIVDDLVAAGCRASRWEDWARQVELDALAAEARHALAAARTERTAAILLDQYAGALREAAEELLALFKSRQSAAAQERLDELLKSAPLGMHLAQPWRVVLAGRPNVGKSSLVNALVGYRRSIVFPTPGTTRDAVTAGTAIDGWPVELVDTAGLRAATDAVEAAGIELAESQLAAADLVLLVCDATQETSPDEEEFAVAWPRVLRVDNKCDLIDAEPSSEPCADSEPQKSLATSALTGQGIEGLLRAVSTRLVPLVPPPGSAVPFTERQIELLEKCRAACSAGDVDSAIAQVGKLVAATG